MINSNSNPESNFSIIKKRLEERLKILETQRKSIKRGNKNRNCFKKIMFLSFLFLASIISFYGYQKYRKNIQEERQILHKKISFFKEQKFRDSVNLLAMNIEIENRAYKKMEDSIQLEVAKKWYAIISDSYYQDKKKLSSVTKFNKKKNKKYGTLISPLKLEKSKFENKNDLSELDNSIMNLKENNLQKTSKNVKIDNTIHVFAVFPGCESKQEKQLCFDVKMGKYIRKHINKKVFKKSGVGRVNVLFTISINGLVKIVKITGAINEIIKKEVIRVIESLPRFKPALNRDNISIPILYDLSINI